MKRFHFANLGYLWPFAVDFTEKSLLSLNDRILKKSVPKTGFSTCKKDVMFFSVLNLENAQTCRVVVFKLLDVQKPHVLSMER